MGKVETLMRYSPLKIWDIVRAHWNAEPKVPVHFIAEPSTVKSEGVRQCAMEIAESTGKEFFEWNRRTLAEKEGVTKDASKYFIFADLRASETDIGELRLQNMNNEQEYITFKYNILFEALSQNGAQGILFFDEMNLASNMIKAQFYKIINDRAVGDIPLSNGVLCVSAGNEAEHSRGVTEDPVPLVLRRGNYYLRPLNAEEYSDYAAKAGMHEWILGYIGFQPNDVHNVKYDMPENTGQPCPRTWVMLDRVLKGNKNLAVDDVDMIANGLLGQGVARKFTAYVKSAKKVNLQEILNKPEMIQQYEGDEDNLSLVYAIIGGVVERFRTDKTVVKPAFEISLHMQRPEFGAYMLRAMKNVNESKFLKAGREQDEELMKKVVEKYAKYLFKK